MDDTWELVVLSSYARSEPPDAAAALRRVGRRRERELAEAAAVASSPVDEDASASSAADGDDAEEDSSSRRFDPDAVVVASGASALDAAAGKQSGLSRPVRSSRLASSTALRHLLALEGAKALYDAAVGTYDVSLAYLVGQHSNMDPGEFVPDLRRLEEMPPRFVARRLIFDSEGTRPPSRTFSRGTTWRARAAWRRPDVCFPTRSRRRAPNRR